MRSPVIFVAVAAWVLMLGAVQAQPAPAKPYKVEWVYRVRYGFQDEWWAIFRKYQVAILDREKQLGYVTNYVVQRPGAHTTEESRWDYRILITYPNYDGSTHEGEVQRQLFPDGATRQREENRRWELTLNHWDLPFRDVDPHADDN